MRRLALALAGLFFITLNTPTVSAPPDAAVATATTLPVAAADRAGPEPRGTGIVTAVSPLAPAPQPCAASSMTGSIAPLTLQTSLETVTCGRVLVVRGR